MLAVCSSLHVPPMNPDHEESQKVRLAMAYDEFAEMLIKSAYYKVHNKSLSEDLVQETFLKTWKYIVKRGEIIDMKAFLYHVLHNLIIDEYRKQRHIISSLDILTNGGFDISTNDHKHQGESFDTTTILKYIEELPTKYREVVYMRIILFMSPEEISNELRRTRNSVTVQLHRGIKRMQLFHEERKYKQGEKI